MNEKFIVMKFINNDIKIDVHVSFEERTVWLTLDQIGILFDRDRSVIGKYIKNIINKETIKNKSVRAKFAHTGPDGKTYVYNYYNLDVIISIGYKINTSITDNFIEWANDIFSKENIDNHPYNSLQSSEIVKYREGNFELDVNVSPQEETVWLDEKRLSILFDVDRRTINYHIVNIFKINELNESVCQKNWQTEINGKRYVVKYYNLDMIISLGYRVNSYRGIAFRRWALTILKQYLLKGYVINDNRCIACQQSIVDISNRLNILEHQANHQIEFNADETLKGYLSIKRFLESAKESILIIDNYFDNSFDDVLKNINVKTTIVTNPKNKNILSTDIYDVIYSNNFHDRYVFVDDVCYVSGQSLKDIGNKISTLYKIYDITQEDMLRKI